MSVFGVLMSNKKLDSDKYKLSCAILSPYDVSGNLLFHLTKNKERNAYFEQTILQCLLAKTSSPLHGCIDVNVDSPDVLLTHFAYYQTLMCPQRWR